MQFAVDRKLPIDMGIPWEAFEIIDNDNGMRKVVISLEALIWMPDAYWAKAFNDSRPSKDFLEAFGIDPAFRYQWYEDYGSGNAVLEGRKLNACQHISAGGTFTYYGEGVGAKRICKVCGLKEYCYLIKPGYVGWTSDSSVIIKKKEVKTEYRRPRRRVQFTRREED